jgi:glycosyltransferase involved in cell wall biosynthesis
LNNSYRTIGIAFPSYCPKKGWEERLLAHIVDWQLFIGEEIHFMLVDDGSQQEGIQAAFDFLYTSIPHFSTKILLHNQGKGAALRAAFQELDCDLYIYTDLDLPFTVKSVERVYNELKNGADVVCGDRGAAYTNRLPIQRKIISHVSRILNRYVLRMKNADTQGGLKGFNQKGKTVFLQTKVKRFLFDTEFIYKAELNMDIKLLTVPIEIQEEVVFSDFGWKTVLTEMRNFLNIRFTK